MDGYPRDSAVSKLLQAFLQETSPIYIVGGAVRDLLLTGQTGAKDWDLYWTNRLFPRLGV